VGAGGGILAVACALPDLCVELYEASRAGDAERARTLQHRLLLPTIKCVSELGIPGVKYAMDCLGYHGGLPRRPLLPLTDAQKREVEAVVASVAAATTAPA
jgi:4-hydroxy-2-oxoglutarate aldolase